jgi:hypothetical protein
MTQPKSAPARTRSAVYGAHGWTLMYPIFSSHIRRIGWVRTLAGALSMYTCIPGLMIMHVTGCVALYQWLLRPLLGLSRVRWADHVIIDRHRIEGMSWLDKFNCMFCSYANGLTTMANMEMDHISRHSGDLPLWRKCLIALVVIAMVPLMLLFELTLQIIYNVMVSRPLGMHRVSMADAMAVLKKEGYGKQFSPPMRWLLRSAKSPLLRFAMALEQVESAWCPLKHLETREGIVYPKHHDRFFGAHQLEEMREVLSTVGTVSDRRPTW